VGTTEARSAIETVWTTRVAGSGEPDVEAWVWALLDEVEASGRLRCAIATSEVMVISYADGSETRLDAARDVGRFRIVCARMAVLFAGADSPKLYGGEGSAEVRWRDRSMVATLRLKNTTGEQEIQILRVSRAR
jgi:hypothetical protein